MQNAKVKRTRGWRTVVSLLPFPFCILLTGYPVDSSPSRSEVMMVAVGFNPRTWITIFFFDRFDCQAA
jgi:hypothetical protein